MSPVVFLFVSALLTLRVLTQYNRMGAVVMLRSVFTFVPINRYAEMAKPAKNAISHRGRSLEKLRDYVVANADEIDALY